MRADWRIYAANVNTVISISNTCANRNMEMVLKFEYS